MKRATFKLFCPTKKINPDGTCGPILKFATLILNDGRVQPKERKPDMLQNNSQLSRGEIRVANFIPPANGASLDSYLVKMTKLHAILYF